MILPSDFLSGMAQSSRARLAAAQQHLSADVLRGRIATLPPAPQLTLDGRFDLIAELKLRSPAMGVLSGTDADLEKRVRSYATAGAAIVSVLTEPDRFDGSLEHLRRAAVALAPTGVPAMRKDFLVDPYQVLEARVAGAGGVLLIVRMLDRLTLQQMMLQAAQLGLFVLLETFDASEVETAHALARAWAGRPYRWTLNGWISSPIGCHAHSRVLRKAAYKRPTTLRTSRRQATTSHWSGRP